MELTRSKSLREHVVDAVRSRIIDGSLQLGEGLSESGLAAELGIPESPVREALQQLRSEGLVADHQPMGSYVFRLSAEQAAMASELRNVVERAAAAAAMQRNHAILVARMSSILDDMEHAYANGDVSGYRALDGEYHQTIVDLSGNELFGHAYCPVGVRIHALRSLLSRRETLNRRSLEQHREMLRLIVDRDLGALQATISAHIADTLQSYVESLDAGGMPLLSHS